MYADYAHDCDASGFENYNTSPAAGSGYNTICYCLGINDNRVREDELYIQSPEYGLHIYNCTFVGTRSSGAAGYISAAMTGPFLCANNLFVADANYATALYTTVTLPPDSLVNNDYWYLGSGAGPISYHGTAYTTLAAFRSATGQETGTGFIVNPAFVSLSDPGVVWPAAPSALTAQMLQPAVSPLIAAGVSLTSYGINPTNDIQGLSTALTNSVGAYSQ
jgi:hypothetical protein